MNNYSVMIKNSAKADLKKIKQSNLKPQFEKVIQTLKEDPYLGSVAKFENQTHPL